MGKLLYRVIRVTYLDPTRILTTHVQPNEVAIFTMAQSDPRLTSPHISSGSVDGKVARRTRIQAYRFHHGRPVQASSGCNQGHRSDQI